MSLLRMMARQGRRVVELNFDGAPRYSGRAIRISAIAAVGRVPAPYGHGLSANSYACDKVDWILEKIVLTPGMIVCGKTAPAATAMKAAINAYSTKS